MQIYVTHNPEPNELRHPMQGKCNTLFRFKEREADNFPQVVDPIVQREIENISRETPSAGEASLYR